MITQFFGTEIIKKLVKSSNTAVTLPSGSVLKLGGVGSILNSTLSLDTSVIGVGGVETAILPNTLYYVYVVLDGVTEKLIASQSAIKPNFLQYRLVGGFYTNYLNNVSTVIGKGDDVIETYVEAAGNGGEAIVPNTQDIPFITTDDTGGLWSGTQFTADRDIIISITGSVRADGATLNAIAAYVNGVFTTDIGYTGTSTSVLVPITGTLKLKAEGIVSMRMDAGSNTTLLNSKTHNLQIKASTPSPLAGLL